MNEPVHARITETSIFLGDTDLTKVCPVAKGGVTVIPGGEDDITRVVVEFFVASATVEEGVL